MVAKYKFYTPLAYSKESSSLPPLAGGKVLPGTIVESQLGHAMDEGHLPQAEGLQQALTPSPPQGRDDHAKEDSILQEAIPQVIRHVDYDISYNYVSHRYKAKVYLNGQRVQEMFDFDLQELKLRLGIRIKQLDATSSVPLTKAVLWTSQPGPWDPKVKAV
ncbi:hypothetical protein ABBQ32_000972 [Trebouxia sp. C0010 RCD-2024]